MDKRIIIVPLLVICLTAAAQPSGRIAWNDGWTFSKDGESRVLNLPHDWGVCRGPHVARAFLQSQTACIPRQGLRYHTPHCSWPH